MTLYNNNMHFLKLKLFKVLTYLVLVFTPVSAALIWMGVFVFIDLVTGIWKAKKNNETISSKKMGNTVTKTVMYFLAIISSRVMDVELLHATFLPFTIAQLVIGFVSLTEFKSIIENISSVLGINMWDFIKNKIDSLRDVK